MTHLTVFDGKAEKQYPWNEETVSLLQLSQQDVIELGLWETIYRDGTVMFLEGD